MIGNVAKEYYGIVQLLELDYDAAKESNDPEVFLYNQVLDIKRIRNIIKFCNEDVKNLFRSLIPKYALILSKKSNITDEEAVQLEKIIKEQLFLAIAIQS